MTPGVGLPQWRSVLAVVAHPDDESFGLGAILSTFTEQARVSVLCFTHGEASTLHGVDGDLHAIREAELRAAAQALRLDDVTLHDRPDGRLGETPVATLAAAVARAAQRARADGLIVFDSTGVTGHPDHQAATAAALAAGGPLGLPVLAWTLPEDVADTLNREFGATFRGHPPAAIDAALQVDRTRQLAAIGCHPSQAIPGSVVWRRLELLGTAEHLRWLRRPVPRTPSAPPQEGMQHRRSGA